MNQITVPLGPYLPWKLETKTLDRLMIRLLVLGHLDRATTDRAADIASSSLLAAAEELRSGFSLLCLKGFDQRDNLQGFRRLAGMPRALLPLRSTYWRDIGTKKRADLLRQRKACASVKRELREGFPIEYGEKILSLYKQTRDKASLKLLDHDIRYFQSTSSVSTYLLYFYEGQLIAFHQMITTGDTLYSQYLGMDYAVSHKLRVYFNLLIDCIDVGLERSKREIDFGITSYRYKKHIGCELQPTWNYFRLSHAYLNWVLPLFDKVLSPDENALR
ncbi:MAG: GNAT family N-acetyltransferase [Betaproteobacteria bacterium]|nr:GNAT family N-acetyltransferase [Betaproteobacteria bacterium]